MPKQKWSPCCVTVSWYGSTLKAQKAELTLSCVLHRFSISLCRLARGESFHWLSLFFNSSTVLKWKDIPNWACYSGTVISVCMYACTCSVHGLLATYEYSACSSAEWTNGGCAASRRNTQWEIWVLRTCGDPHLFMRRNRTHHFKYFNTKKHVSDIIYHCFYWLFYIKADKEYKIHSYLLKFFGRKSGRNITLT